MRKWKMVIITIIIRVDKIFYLFITLSNKWFNWMWIGIKIVGLKMIMNELEKEWNIFQQVIQLIDWCLIDWKLLNINNSNTNFNNELMINILWFSMWFVGIITLNEVTNI